VGRSWPGAIYASRALLARGNCWAEFQALWSTLAAKVRALKSANPVGPLQGLPLHAFDELRRVLEACAPLRHASELFLAQRILRRNAQGEDEIWTARSAEEAFSEELTIDARMSLVTNGRVTSAARRAAKERDIYVLAGADVLRKLAAQPCTALDVQAANDRRLASMRDVQTRISAFCG
jgi:hypothetical protein